MLLSASGKGMDLGSPSNSSMNQGAQGSQVWGQPPAFPFQAPHRDCKPFLGAPVGPSSTRPGSTTPMASGMGPEALQASQKQQSRLGDPEPWTRWKAPRCRSGWLQLVVLLLSSALISLGLMGFFLWFHVLTGTVQIWSKLILATAFQRV